MPRLTAFWSSRSDFRFPGILSFPRDAAWSAGAAGRGTGTGVRAPATEATRAALRTTLTGGARSTVETPRLNACADSYP